MFISQYLFWWTYSIFPLIVTVWKYIIGKCLLYNCVFCFLLTTLLFHFLQHLLGLCWRSCIMELKWQTWLTGFRKWLFYQNPSRTRTQRGGFKTKERKCYKCKLLEADPLDRLQKYCLIYCFSQVTLSVFFFFLKLSLYKHLRTMSGSCKRQGAPWKSPCTTVPRVEKY